MDEDSGAFLPSLRAGIAVHNAGEYHAAHDAWEDHWLDLKREVADAPATVEQVTGRDLPAGESAAADERLLHGLIQFTAAAHHLDGGNPGGARGLADSARAYLDPLPGDYRAVNVEAVRSFLAGVLADPTDPEVPELAHDGRALTYEDLGFEATAVAAGVLAEEYGYDEEVIGAGVEYARRDLADDGGRQFVALVFDFVREAENRGIVADRLAQRVRRRRHREDDVRGLF